MSPEDLHRQNGITLDSYAPGRYYTTCPNCSAGRSTAEHRREKVLGVTIEADGSVRFGCNHCPWTGPQKGCGERGNVADGPALPFYLYRDLAGVVRFRKVRNAPGRKPRFWLEHPDGNGGWIKNTKDVETSILYRADKVAKAIGEGRTILCVEGEKDVDNLWRIDFAATCNAHGASEQSKAPKWTKKHSEQLRDADVVVLNDNDAPGYAHAKATCQSLLGIAKRVRRLDLKDAWPDIPPGSDVSDWIAQGHTRNELAALIESAPDYALAPPLSSVSVSPSAHGAGREDRVALQFAARHKDDYRYVALTGKWLIWAETRWRIENTLAAFDAARKLCREAGKADAKVVAAVEKLARSDRRLSVTVEQFDADPWLLATPSGTVDLKTGATRPARREDYITKMTTVAPAPRIADGAAPPDLWLSFLDRVFNKNDELNRLRATLPRLLLERPHQRTCVLFLIRDGPQRQRNIRPNRYRCDGRLRQHQPNRGVPRKQVRPPPDRAGAAAQDTAHSRAGNTEREGVGRSEDQEHDGGRSNHRPLHAPGLFRLRPDTQAHHRREPQA
jgi:hypothetical protein